jgi:predicted metal-dependent peptidase
MLRNETFYAHFILQCKIVKHFKDPRGKAGVGFDGGVPTIFMDMDYFNKQPLDEVTDTLKHEVLHLVLNHLTRTKMEKLDPMVSNIAQDCVINQHLSHLPKNCVSLDMVKKLAKDDKLQPWQTSDYYYNALMKQYKTIKAKGVKNQDVHMGYFGDDIPQDMVDAMVKKAADKAVKAAGGAVPHAIMKSIETLGQSTLPWKTLLRNNILSQVSKKTETTRKRINRRFDLPVPGKKKKRELT